MLTKDLVVVGHGRGATSYAAYWLQKQDINVMHERLGPQGIVESGFSVPTWGIRTGPNEGLTRDQFIFRNKICIVRDPYKVIATYEQIEHPCAILCHQKHLPGFMVDLLPPDWENQSEHSRFEYFMMNHPLRINAIARSVIRWTKSGIDWCDGMFLRAEDEWAKGMPGWLKDRGLWVLPGREPNEVPKDKVNHRQGRRLTQDEINSVLRPDVYGELIAYREEVGYNG